MRLVVAPRHPLPAQATSTEPTIVRQVQAFHAPPHTVPRHPPPCPRREDLPAFTASGERDPGDLVA